MWWRTALALVVAGLLAAAPSGLAGAAWSWSEVSRGDPGSGMVALTFDAGSVDGPAATILDTLHDRGLKVTCFLTGQWVESYPELARRLAADGHELANHTYYHPDLTQLSDQQIRWELEYTNAVIEARLGRTSRPWFRPPFGARDQRVLAVAEELGYRSVYWTLDSGDWRTGVTPGAVLRRVLSNVEAGDIVVHHLASDATAQALPEILDALAARGLRVVTVSELLGVAPPADGATPSPLGPAS